MSEEIFIIVLYYLGFAIAYIAGKNDILKVFTDRIIKFCEAATDIINNRESDIVVEDVIIEGEAEEENKDIISLDEIIKMYEENFSDNYIARQTLKYFKELKRRRGAALDSGVQPPSKIFYLCDRRDKCSPCNCPPCYHTADIEHAVNFTKHGDAYFENIMPTEESGAE